MLVYTKLFGAFFICLCILLCLVSYLIKNDILRNTFSRLILLSGSVAFFLYSGKSFIWFYLYLIIITYIGGLCISKTKRSFWIFTLLLFAPLLAYKLLSWSSSNIIQPLGISFITLQSYTYFYALYKNEMECEKGIVQVALFVSFFPCLSSGPIMDAGVLLPQFKKIRSFDYERVTDGIRLYGWGLLKKLVLADNLALYISGVKENAQSAEHAGTALLITALLYSFQLYFDFSGYSDIVVGCGKVMGFDLTRNFNHPYLSKTVAEFWNRWHISLSGWLKKYIYIPLGGSRVNVVRIYVNTMIVFLVSGFWHGNGVTFLVWGILHGLFVCIDRALKKKGYKGNVFITYMAVSFAWIFFAAPSVSSAVNTIISFAGIPNEIKLLALGEIGSLSSLLLIPENCNVLLILSGLFIFGVISHITYKKDGNEIVKSLNPIIRWCCYYALIMAILLFSCTEQVNFIYNQF